MIAFRINFSFEFFQKIIKNNKIKTLNSTIEIKSNFSGISIFLLDFVNPLEEFTNLLK